MTDTFNIGAVVDRSISTIIVKVTNTGDVDNFYTVKIDSDSSIKLLYKDSVYNYEELRNYNTILKVDDLTTEVVPVGEWISGDEMNGIKGQIHPKEQKIWKFSLMLTGEKPRNEKICGLTATVYSEQTLAKEPFCVDAIINTKKQSPGFTSIFVLTSFLFVTYFKRRQNWKNEE